MSFKTELGAMKYLAEKNPENFKLKWNFIGQFWELLNREIRYVGLYGDRIELWVEFHVVKL